MSTVRRDRAILDGRGLHLHIVSRHDTYSPQADATFAELERHYRYLHAATSRRARLAAISQIYLRWPSSVIGLS